MCHTIIYGCTHPVTTYCNLPKTVQHPLTTTDSHLQEELRLEQAFQNNINLMMPALQYCPGPRPATTKTVKEPCYACVQTKAAADTYMTAVAVEEMRFHRLGADNDNFDFRIRSMESDGENGGNPNHFCRQGDNGMSAPMLPEDRVGQWPWVGVGLRPGNGGFRVTVSGNGTGNFNDNDSHNFNGNRAGKGTRNFNSNGNGIGNSNRYFSNAELEVRAGDGMSRLREVQATQYGQYSLGEQGGQGARRNTIVTISGRRTESI